MANPSTRTELKDYCLRSLGAPVIEINVDDDQLEDRIDDALHMFIEHHYDASEHIWLASQVTEADILNKYVKVPDCILGVRKVLPISSAQTNNGGKNAFNIWDINYQLRLNDFYNLSATSYTYYVITREHLSMLDMIISGEIPLNFNRKTGRINLVMDWASRLTPGDFLVFEATKILDPEDYTLLYNDVWLKEYTTQLFKRQWGRNMTKYKNYVLPGGIEVNGEQILEEANAEIIRLEDKLRNTYEEPVDFFMG